MDPLFSGFSLCASTGNHFAYTKKAQISKTRFWQNCSVAKMLCFAVLSASLPCAMLSEMHVLKKARGARNTVWDSDFVSCHHDIAKKAGKSRLRTLLLLQISPLPQYCVLQCFSYFSNYGTARITGRHIHKGRVLLLLLLLLL